MNTFMISRFLICISLFFIWNAASAQTVQSDCAAPASVRDIYIEDASRMCLRHLEQTGQSSFDSVIFPVSVRDTFLRALYAVYNAQGLAARDSILDIHTFSSPELMSINVEVFNYTPWMGKLKQNIFPTGTKEIDDIFKRYALKMFTYNSSSQGPLDNVILRSDSFINTKALEKVFKGVSSVNNAYRYWYAGDGNDISCVIFPDFIQLTYRKAWGDCPAGCIYSHYWRFKVFQDCKVEFTGSWGDKLGIEDNNQSEQIGVAPNPFNEKIAVQGLANESAYRIFDSNGKMIREGNVISSIDDLNALSPGLYILQLISNEKYLSYRVLKE